MIFGMTWDERNAIARDRQQRYEDRRRRGLFALFPRQLSTGRWGWLERLPYTDEWDWTYEIPRVVRTYYPPGTVLE